MKRRLSWQEEGADLDSYAQPSCLGGPADKRNRDFTAKLEASAPKKTSWPVRMNPKSKMIQAGDTYLFVKQSIGSPKTIIESAPLIFLAPLSPVGTDDASSDSEVGSEECRNMQAKSRAQQERKKAGLPELEVDALPSAIATRMMTLT